MTAPGDFSRRSFVARKLAAAGAAFEARGDAAVAHDFGDAAGEGDAAARLGLVDLSPLARTGFKGAGAVEWLEGQGIVMPGESNRAARQEGGALAARLAPAEVLILGGVDADDGLPERLDAAWNGESLPPVRPRGYPLPRRDTHAWFLVTGDEAPAMLAKLCAVDLRPDKFPGLAIAQTSMARISAIVIRCDRESRPAFHLLSDSASAEYFWDCLIDAMEEFGGGPVGLSALGS